MFDVETLDSLYRSGSGLREVAIRNILENFSISGNLFFKWIIEEDPEDLIRMAPQTLWWLSRGIPIENVDVRRSRFEVFSEQSILYSSFMGYLDEHLSTNPSSDRLLHRLHLFFPGIRSDLERINPLLRDKLGPSEKYRQLMVFVCGQCNLHCPYCFSHDLKKREISASDLQRIFEWGRREGLKKITPCGGEPLLYSGFKDFLKLTEKNGMTTYMASNMTIDVGGIPFFTSDTIEKIHIHFTRESLSDKDMMNTLFRNIEICHKREIEMSARVNITSPDSKEMYRWIDLTKERGIRRLNVALTIPSRFKANVFTDPDAFGEYIATICNAIDYADNAGIAFGIAKPLPLCLFPKEKAERLMRFDTNISLCGIHHADYMNNLSLSTDLYFSPCLGLSDIRRKFSENYTWDELKEDFSPMVCDLLNRNVYSKCDKCFLRSRGLCQGFCLSYKYNPDDTI